MIITVYFLILMTQNKEINIILKSLNITQLENASQFEKKKDNYHAERSEAKKIGGPKMRLILKNTQ